MRILCFTGDAGTGKTTLIERLLSHLPLDPASVGVLKHTHHRLDWHPPGKDTTRFWQTRTTHQNVAGWSSEQPGTVVLTRDDVGTIARHVWDWAVELDELALPMSPSASRP